MGILNFLRFGFHHFRIVTFFAIAAAAAAQGPLAPDAPGCADSRTFPKFPGCRIDNCEKQDGDHRDLTIKEDEHGQPVTTPVDGDTRTIMYECTEDTKPKSIVEQAAAALRAAGFQVPYLFAEEEGALTAHNPEMWLTIESASHFYTLVELKLTAPDFESINDAASMADAIEKYGRVPLYGIHFLSGRADIAPESVIALRELAIMLDENPDWNIRVEGHTDNVGAKEVNTVLSLRRATAVSAYLAGRGVKKTRVEAAGMADSHPIASNDTEAGRAKNRRIEIVKLPEQPK